MKPRSTLLPLLALVSAPLFAAEEAAVPPRDWIDPQTGHRIIRLSPDTGGTSLYFHQHTYTPEGDKLIIQTRDGIGVVDISTLGVSPPKFDLVVPGMRNVLATAWRTREAYYRQGDALMAVHLDTKAVRKVVDFPPQARGFGNLAVNADESRRQTRTAPAARRRDHRRPPRPALGRRHADDDLHDQHQDR
jgi:oligogalacturonide lyase